METHRSVLTREVCDVLVAEGKAATVVDATLGSGGHARAILAALPKNSIFVGIDADKTAIDTAGDFTKEGVTVHLVHGNFREIDRILHELSIERADAVLADLGWRTEQFSQSGKGFSFQEREPLVMTYGDPADYPFTARDIVNEWSEASIANVIFGYGEERKARRIARAIVNARNVAPIETTDELVGIVESVKGRRGKVHPATQTFQALRIAVNDELRALEEFIDHAIERLKEEGTLAIITFHSVEDRIVKQRFRGLAEGGLGTIRTKKPVTAAPDELAANPRARSAKLRVFTRHSP